MRTVPSALASGAALLCLWPVTSSTSALSVADDRDVTAKHAARKPTKREGRAIKRAALRHCRSQESPGLRCRWRGRVSVSTVNPRFAWAAVDGPQYDNSGLLKRSSRRARRWRMVRVVGGGIQPCSYWYAVAPRRVVRDLKIRGYNESSGNFDNNRC